MPGRYGALVAPGEERSGRYGALVSGSAGGRYGSLLGESGAPAEPGLMRRGFGGLVDILSRGQYASAAYVATAGRILDDPSASVWKRTFAPWHAARAAVKEAFIPEDRLGFENVIEEFAPTFAQGNPRSTAVLGFIGNVALDPLSWVSFGGGSAVKIAGKEGIEYAVKRSAVRELAKQAGVAPQRFDRLRTLLGQVPGVPKALRDESQTAIEQMYQLEKSRLRTQMRDEMADAVTGLRADEMADAARGNAARGNAVRTQFPGLPASFRTSSVSSDAATEAARVQKAEAMFPGVPTRVVAGTPGKAASSAGHVGVNPADRLRNITQHYDTRFQALATARDELRTQVFRSSDELEEAATKLLGYAPVKATIRTPEERIADLLADPVVYDKVAERGGIKLAGQSVISGKAVGRVGQFTGLSKLKERVKEIWGSGTQGLNRNWGLDNKYVRLRQEYEDAVQSAERRVTSAYQRVFDGLGKESATKIGRAMLEARDLAKLNPNADAVTLRRLSQDMYKSRLTDKEFGAAMQLRSEFDRVQKLEAELGLLATQKANYAPRYYAAIENGKRFAAFRRGMRSKLPHQLDEGEREVFGSLAEATAAGFRPVEDAAVTYMHRMLSSERALAAELFNRGVKQMYPELSVVGGRVIVKEGTSPTRMDELERIARDIGFVGEGLYGPGSFKSSNKWLQAYDRTMSAFRKSATVVRPSFGARQSVSNALQNALVQGMGVLSPATFVETAAMLAGRGDSLMIRTALGERMSGAQLLEEAAKHGILRGTAMDITAGPARPKYLRDIQRAVDRDRALRELGGDNAARKGFVNLMDNALRYTDIPGKIEDFGRLAGYVNARRIGHNPRASRDLVDKALFDYMNGLSPFEQRFMRRVVPFYSFNRFAVPLMAKVLAQTPGRVVNTAKTTRDFLAAWSHLSTGEALTDSERRVLPGWLLEQPHAFVGFNEKQQAVFNAFNNFSPLDLLGFMTPVSGGADTEERTLLETAVLAQMTPVIKVPIEMMYGRDSFTGQSLEKRRKLGNVDPDEVFRNITASATATASGNAVLASLAGAATNLAPSTAQKVVQELMGWEEGVDPKTGERAVYVNAFRTHVLTSLLPGMQDALKMARDDRSAGAKTMHLLFGVSTTEMDLSEQRVFRLQNMDRKLERKRYDAERALLEERHASYLEALEDLQELAQVMKEESEAAPASAVRGKYGGGP